MHRLNSLFCILRILAVSLLLPTLAFGWRLHVLVRGNNVQQVALALRTEPALGFQINWQEDRDGLTPLEIAKSYNNQEMINLLVEYGAIETAFESGSPASVVQNRRRHAREADLLGHRHEMLELTGQVQAEPELVVAPKSHATGDGLFDLDD